MGGWEEEEETSSLSTYLPTYLRRDGEIELPYVFCKDFRLRRENLLGKSY